MHFTQLTKLLKEGGRKTTQGGAIRTVKHCYLGEAPWPGGISLPVSLVLVSCMLNLCGLCFFINRTEELLV